MKNAHVWALRAAAVLWVVWGLVHILAGVLTIGQETAAAVAGVADAVDPAVLIDLKYHAAAGGLIKQHGWNLAWIGLTTVVCAVFVWRKSRTAIWVAALVGGMADLGYFLFMDLPGHVNFLPGTLMTLVSGAAILLSGWVWFATRGNGSASA